LQKNTSKITERQGDGGTVLTNS